MGVYGSRYLPYICKTLHFNGLLRNMLIGNRVTEADIRDWLNQNGFKGQAAKFGEIELHAIRRPGWRQIFRFDCRVRNDQDGGDDEFERLWGVLRNDETQIQECERTAIAVFKDQSERDRQLELWVNELNESAGGSSDANWYAVAAVIGLITLLLGIAVLAKAIFN